VKSRLLLPALLPAFVVLATLNSGGYRYGASDQAFYQPAVVEKLHPELYPRDSGLIAAQARLTLYDEVVAGLVRTTGQSVPLTFAVLYVLSLMLVATGAWLVARQLFLTSWGAVAFLAAMTLRHAIARSGTNTLEGYFHPRQVAFGLGLIAVGMFLRGRLVPVAALLLIAGLFHPTAALWFAVWLAAAAMILDAMARRWIALAAIPATIGALWAFTAGPLAGRLGVMDAEWLALLGTKEYLFPLDWPAYAWTLNLGYLVLVSVFYRLRQRAGLVAPPERALVLGSAALAACFAVALITQAMHITLSFQLQPARLFLIFDFLATLYIVWALAELPTRRAPAVVAVVLTVASLARGGAVLASGRPFFRMDLAADDWTRVMAWARTTDVGSAWLADPLHAAVHGTSVRVAGERDVFVEAIKDAALGIYDRDIARRTDQRFRAIKDFHLLTKEQVTSLAREYDLEYFVTPYPFDLPVAFESGPLRVYRLR
jgi:hypothetical protein